MIESRSSCEYGPPVPGPRITRSLFQKIESEDLPVQALQAIHKLRAYLDNREATHLLKARELGASSTDIAEALGITRQGVYNKLRSLERARQEEPIVIPDLETPQPS